MGYPPRKKDDTSIGDAYNWEWIVHCASNSPDNSNVLIVSRDSDFGSIDGNKAILNDWLKQEFKDRVSRKRKIEMTPRLTDAMKRLDETVTEEDIAQESKLIETQVRAIRLLDISRYRNKGAANRLTYPDVDFEIILEGDPELDDVVPNWDDDDFPQDKGQED